jgi:DNA-binding response OmpR family regulator
MTATDARPRILIIEDDPDIASFEETMLDRAGYQTRIAATGREGLDLVKSYAPDVVLLDIGLPDMSGLDVCTTVAETADAYILMVSGHSGEDVKLTGLGLGADDFISKPFSGNELVARIGSFLRRRERGRQRDHDGRLQVGDAALVRDLHTLKKGARSRSPLSSFVYFGS